MTYLFIGDDSEIKNLQIDALKQKFLTPPSALSFDYEVLYAHKLEPEILKKALVALPVFAKKRVIIVREYHKLSPHNKTLIVEFAENPASCVLILDAEKLENDDELLKPSQRPVKIIRAFKKEESTLFDLTRAVMAHQSADALKVTYQLLSKGEHPLQILGGLVWFWTKSRAQLPETRFREGLLALEEGDLNIKRSRLKPEHALEVLVVKLCS